VASFRFQTGLISRASLLLLLSFSLLFFSGCRTKCIKGGENYPECLGGDAPSATAEKREMVIWNLFDPKDAFAGQLQAFQSEYPGMKITYKKFENEDRYEEILLNALAEGRGPDIFAIHQSWLPRHQKKIFPMPENMMVSEQFRETFFDVTADVLLREDEEKFERIYGLPLFVDTLAIYYNTTVFRDGLQSSSRPAETWEGIKEQVYSLKRTDNSVERFALSGMAMGRADNIFSAISVLSLLFLQEGVQFLDESGTKILLGRQQGTKEGTGKPFYPAQEALKLYTSFALPSYKHYSWNRVITGLYPTQKEVGVFVRGKAAMIFGFSSLYPDILAALEGQRKSGQDTIRPDEIGVAAVPQFLPLAESIDRHSFANFYPLTVSRNTNYPEEAWELLFFLTGAESAMEYHRKTKKPTARFDLIDEQVSEKFFGVFAQQVPYSKVLPVFDQEKFAIIFGSAIDVVASSKLDASDAMKLAEKRMQCLLDQQHGRRLDEDCPLVR